MNIEHTPEPWHVGVRTAHSKRDIYGPQGSIVALADGVFTSLPEAQANARRIVACVNACAGIDDPEKYIALAKALADETHKLVAQRDELVAALDRAAVMLERVTRRGGFVVGCDAAAKEARAALAKLET